jgi:nickel-dependent lactate racemase
MNEIRMSYGRNGLNVRLDASWQIETIRKPAMPILSDTVAALEAALTSPVDAPTLEQLAAKARRVCLVVCDITRPVPNGFILSALMRRLTAAGVPKDAITVLIATGLHRPNEGAEMAAVIGDANVLKTVKVVNHFAERDEDHVTLGTTSRGTPVRLDRRFVEADLRIVVGLVEPHFMAGYSGGRKLIAPGCAHADTIGCIHHARMLEHPAADNGSLDGNPVHDELLQIARMVGPVFAVSVVLDEERRISHVNFGGLEASHAAAVNAVRRFAECPVSRKYGVVLTSSAGFPLDLTYYQTIKGMVGAMGALRPGGHLFIVSECAEGFGSAGFRKAQQRLVREGADNFMAYLHTLPRAPVDAWQAQMLVKVTRCAQVHLFSGGLPLADWADTGVRRVEKLEAELAAAVKDSGEPALAVIPEGPYVIPVAR